jgi:hypothetical protein
VREAFPTLLIDSSHRRWILWTLVTGAIAVGAYFGAAGVVPGGLTGGSPIGLWYGIIGTGLMVYAGLLAAHRKLPRWTWLGARKVWLKGHIWLGLLSAVFLLCHSGFRWGGPLEFVLWLAVIGVLTTGIFGLMLQQVLPRLLTVRVPSEAPYEQIPHLCQVMRRKADALVDVVCGPFNPEAPNVESTQAVIKLVEDSRAQLRTFYEHDVRPYLSLLPPRRSPLANPLQAEARFTKIGMLSGLAEVKEELSELATLCEERRQLAEQERIHFWLHAWLAVHVPLSAGLLVLVVAHVASALYW